MTKLNWIIALFILLMIGLIAAVPWVMAAEHLERYTDEQVPVKCVVGCVDPCLAKMEAAMRAVDIFFDDQFPIEEPGTYKAPDVTMTRKGIEQAKQTLSQWNAVKAECWRK